ncbi:MAG: hypothetical protein RML95_15450, partial [Anaerolineae bacterium]|nr:hypothetical protein [Anaerolineae bacterium]
MSAQSNPKLTSLVPELRRLLNEQGTALLDEPTRLRGWLSDLAPSCAPERNLIMTALEEGVPQALRKLQSLDKTTLHQLALRLETNRSIASDRAQWAVLEWAQALGVRVPQLAPTNTAQSAISNRPLSNAPQSSTAQKTPTPAPQHKPAVAALNAQANTAQSLPRLVPWSPLSYIRLLVWTLW